MFCRAVWLGVPRSEIEKKMIFHGDMNGRFAYYRCDINVDQPASLRAVITANSRYRLWVNGHPVLSGPCKGDRYRHYYENIDLSEYLRQGVNSFAVQVLLTDPNAVVTQGDERTPILAVASLPAGHRLAFEGQILNEHDEVQADLTTGCAPWRLWLDNTYYLKCKEININMGAIAEDIDFSLTPSDWKTGECELIDWVEPAALDPVIPGGFERKVGFLPKFPVMERPIPLLYEKPGALSAEIGTAVFQNRSSITVPAYSRQLVIFDAGLVTNAYMIYDFSGGQGASVKLTYFEKFSKKDQVIHRTDYQHGEIEGMTDELLLAGKSLRYEPFWFRTFRFLRIEIETAGEALTMEKPHYRSTGYPLNPVSEMRSSADWVKPVWDMCVNTLQGCMTETYMDCPFYEQMQFPMDTRLQALFTYAVSQDTRLARKALVDYHHSMIPEGLIQGKYPSSFIQVISTFSLHYVFMLQEYYLQTGDLEIIRLLRSDVDAVLAYFDRKIGSNGLVENLDYWPFVDWQPAWAETAGVPLAGQGCPSTIINLMYGYALASAANICTATGRPGLAEEYRQRQADITSRIQELCWDDNKGLYRDGPEVSRFSQHAQAWAVLNGMTDTDSGQQIMGKALQDPAVIPCSFAASFELFRALEQVGLQNAIIDSMQAWADLLDMGCTTCPETPGLARSECHAWSALPIYEMTRVLAGIQSTQPGWSSAVIAPCIDSLPDLTGQVITPAGLIRFCYRRLANGTCYDIEMPDGLPGVFRYPGGTEVALKSGQNTF